MNLNTINILALVRDKEMEVWARPTKTHVH
jgi:hypothetical protein